MEGDVPFREVLDPLVSLAGHHYDVAGSRRLQRAPDRLPPVELDAGPREIGAGLDLSCYLLGVLRVGVVRRDQAHVGEKRGYPSHLGPLRPIPISGRPEHTDNPPPATGYPPRHPQDGIQPNVGVGVVYDYLEPVLSGRRDPLEASRHLSHPPHRTSHRRFIRPDCEREGDGPSDV